MAALKAEVREMPGQAGQTGIEDIIKPLATKIRKLGVNVHELFEQYDRNKNFRISAEELSMGLSSQGIKLEPEEV